jgi:hypothetical protein
MNVSEQILWKTFSPQKKQPPKSSFPVKQKLVVQNFLSALQNATVFHFFPIFGFDQSLRRVAENVYTILCPRA